jgi:hypothetical protein
LKNPGGDFYDLENRLVKPARADHDTFAERIGKDLAHAWGNIKNFFKNMVTGADRCYRDKQDTIASVRQTGLVKTVGDFFKNMASALSFGAYRPDGEPECEGIAERLQFSFGKAKSAVLGNLLQGTSNSLVHMGENLALAGWNLIEVAPDATIGNLEKGRHITTKIFDNGQVAIEYLTDILPGGDAWLRVHAANLKGGREGLPVLYNLGLPERLQDDARWQTVRNTPLRKAIETIGSLVADVVAAKMVTECKLFSHEGHKNKHPESHEQ